MKRLHYIFVSVFVSVCLLGVAQTTSSTEVARQNEAIRRSKAHLAEIEALVGQNRKELLGSEQGLRLVRNRIEARRGVVRGLDVEMRRLTGEINADVRQTRELDTMLARLKRNYARLVYSAWKTHKMTSTTAFLLASRDFNDATRRLAYIRRYHSARQEKAVEIDSLNGALQARIELLNAKKIETAALKAESDSALKTLAADEAQYREAQKTLRANRRKLDADAQKERERIADAQSEIDKIMARQTSRRSEVLSEAEIELSGRFEDNRGRLPWPLGGPATVVATFGKERMADGIENDSKGIMIAAKAGTPVRAVFDGKVTAVYGIPPFDKVITVRSGSYIMLYGNIADTSLKSGDEITSGRTIGSLSSFGENAGTYRLLFQIWHEKTALDPEEWLRK